MDGDGSRGDDVDVFVERVAVRVIPASKLTCSQSDVFVVCLRCVRFVGSLFVT